MGDIRAAVEELSVLTGPAISKAVNKHRGVVVINLSRGSGKSSSKVSAPHSMLTCRNILNSAPPLASFWKSPYVFKGLQGTNSNQSENHYRGGVCIHRSAHRPL